MNRKPLSVTNPDLAAQALGWDPKEVSAGSEKVLPWNCTSGHVWEAMVKRRAYGQKCPICAGRKIVVGFNDLATTHPDLASQLVDADPLTIIAGTARKLQWHCSMNHEWVATVAHRTSRGDGCPYCSGRKVLPGYNDLATTHQDLAAQALDWEPKLVSMGSHQVLSWRCAEGHVWKTSPNSRSNGGHGCPICSNQMVLPGYNDLATTHPQLAVEADGWEPTAVTAGTQRKFAWRCFRGHSWSASVNARAGKDKTGCPFCSNKMVLKGYNDLATIRPDIAAEAFGWDPTTLVYGSHAIQVWRCDRGHTWRATLDRRTGANATGCPVCSGNQVLAGYNDLDTVHPEIAAEASGWDPSTVTAGSKQKREWRCERGHLWTASIGGRTGKNKNGCPVCDNKILLVGYNDLATTHPGIAAQAFRWDPTTIVGGSNKTQNWQCPKGHVWSAITNNRTGRNDGCPVCDNKILLVGYNDLATTHPGIAAQAFRWDPTSVVGGNHQKRKWQCDGGHTWSATIDSRTHSQSGCPSCSVSGFDPNKNGWLYFLEHERWGLLQIGISNVPKSRLRQHELKGWQILEVRGPLAGDITFQWEQDILHALKRRGVTLGHEGIAGKFSGYTESWIQEEFPVRSLRELMELVYVDE